MANEKPLSELSTDELTDKEKSAKNGLYLWIGLIILMTLAAIANTIMEGFSFSSLLPVFFAGILGLQYGNWKKVKEELAKRL
jgi:uncharacterized membrane protein